jgi:transposase
MGCQRTRPPRCGRRSPPASPLRVYQLPAYAPELNPVEKVWSAMKGSLANLAVRTATELAPP